MKKIFLAFLCVIHSTLMVSQTFNTLYSIAGDVVFEDFIKIDSAYVFVGNKVNNNQPIFAWFDMQGNLMKDSLDRVNHKWRMENIVKMGNDFILIETNNVSTQELIRLSVCDANFQIKYQYNFNEVLNFYVTNSRLVNDSIFAIVGSTENQSSNGLEFTTAIYFLNMLSGEDTLVEIGTPSSMNFAADVVYMKEKYYVTQSSNQFASQSNNSNTMVALSRWNADFSLDTILPIYNTASNISGSGFFSIVSALKLSDSTFMMTGRTEMIDSSNYRRRYDIGVVKWNADFSELNAVTFGRKDSSALEAYQGLSRYENDSFVYAAGTENYIGGFTSASYFMLSKLNLKGDILWTRYYSNNTLLQMYKVMATADGGAIMMGKSYDNRFMKNDAWILKVDSNGNMANVPTSIVENGEIPEKDFVFFPNPSKDYLTFRQLNTMRNYHINLYSIEGRLVYQAEVSESEKKIDVSSFAKGFYIYRLTDEMGNKAEGKLIKQ